jgi:hypothetical protein
MASGTRRIALISNVMLEAGTKAVIPVRSGTQERQVPVRCREIERDYVVLEVQGHPTPVRLIRTEQL